MHNGSSCAQRYEQLVSERETFLDRARECARLTIPTLMPESGHSQSSRFYTPYQGIGARGVNNLAAKLLLSLLPPNSPFFRLTIDDFTLEELTKQEGMRAKVEEGLNKDINQFGSKWTGISAASTAEQCRRSLCRCSTKV